MKSRGMMAAAVLLAAMATLGGCGERIEAPPAQVVPLFENVTVHFTPADSTKYDTPMASARDNGRVMSTYRELPARRGSGRVMLHLAVRPIRADIRSVVDRWDRAGSVRLVRPGMAPVELCRFMTAYGGAITHDVDVTRAAPLLQGSGRCCWPSQTWNTD